MRRFHAQIMIASLVIVLFMIYPTLLQQCAGMFKCQDIEVAKGVVRSYLVADMRCSPLSPFPHPHPLPLCLLTSRQLCRIGTQLLQPRASLHVYVPVRYLTK